MNLIDGPGTIGTGDVRWWVVFHRETVPSEGCRSPKLQVTNTPSRIVSWTSYYL